MGGESIEEELSEEMMGLAGVDKEMTSSASEGETLVGMEEEGENAEIYTGIDRLLLEHSIIVHNLTASQLSC